jgi:Xaa-Pro aminopeptidase
MPHGLGHGIGLTVHDSPGLRKKPTHEALLKTWVPSPIEEGMIFTIEPGIYEKDVGGFRLENDVLITKNGAQVLTNSKPVLIDLP